MSTFEQAIDVNVSVSTAYNQWTQFEEFPKFMEGIEEVKQINDTDLYWRANILGNEQTWDATITEQIPDQRIAWKSTNGAHHAGVVSFHRLDENNTRVMLQIEYNPEGFIENVGDALGLVKVRMVGDLERFKSFIENRDEETGAWRGIVEQENQ